MKLGLGIVALAAIVAHPSWASSGEEIFNANCSICHQSGGVGVPGQFPRLAGRASSIAGKSEGRDYLASVALNGLSGAITVDGQKIVGVMPPFRSQSDDDLAAVLTYVAQLGGGKAAAFTAEEITLVRAKDKIPASKMGEQRAKLVEAKVVQ